MTKLFIAKKPNPIQIQQSNFVPEGNMSVLGDCCRLMLFHHDNASAHTAAAALDFLTENSVNLVTYPPCSSDLVLFNRFLFHSSRSGYWQYSPA